MIVLYPYKVYSNSAKKLQKLLKEDGHRCKRVYADGRYFPKKKHIIINWGNTKLPEWANNLYFPQSQILNHPANVQQAVNKITTFSYLGDTDVPIPEWTTDKEIAKRWFVTRDKVVCRSTINSSGGRGIVIAEDVSQLIDAPLYVKYKKKRKEFRVHVFKGKVIDVLEKKKSNGFRDLPEFNPLIRSHNNGWVFCRDGVVKPNTLDSVAIQAVEALGLDFGGVDVIWNEKDDKCYVLEVNTAPGLEGTSLVKYKEAILELL